MARKRTRGSRERSYSMPEHSQLFGKPPFVYRDSTTILVQFQTDARVLRRLVPQPLTPNKDANLFVSVAEFMASGFGHYYEAHLFTHATFQRRPVNYSIYLVLDNDIAIGAGREIWGFPKKLGRLAIDLTDDVVRATVERGGITLIEASMHLATFADPSELAGPAEWIAHKLIPSVSLDSPPECDQLTSTTLTDIEIRELYTGSASLSFAASPADRLAEIPIKKMIGGYYYRTDFTLGDGEVAHDYLS